MNKTKAIEIYNKYLSTPAVCFDGSKKLPIKGKTLEQMLKTCNQLDKNLSSTIEKALKSSRRVLFWSDQHFFHHNIIAYASRPVDDVQEMNDMLIKNYMKSIKKDDIVVWLGDCSFGDSHRARNFLQNANLPGYKILIVGNHDFEKNKYTYRDMGIFDEVCLCDGFDLKIDENEYELILTHYPLEKSFFNDNTINIHGHIHEKNIGYPWVNVSVEQIGYAPQELSTLIEIAKRYKPAANIKASSFATGV